MKLLNKIALSCFVLSMAFSQATAEQTGLASGTQTLIPVGASAIAKGGAVVASVKGIEALHFNPAGIVSGNSEAGASITNWIADTRVTFAGLTYVSESSAFGVYLKSIDVGDIQQTTVDDPDGEALPMYNPTIATFGVGYATLLTDRIQAGFAAKFVTEDYLGVSASAVALDIGAQYDFESGLRLGVTLRGLGSEMRFHGQNLKYELTDKSSSSNGDKQYEIITKSSPLPSAFDVGVSYVNKIDESSNLVFDLSASVMSQSKRELSNLALEYNYDSFAIRGGYNLTTLWADNELSDFSAGLGLMVDTGSGNTINIDYAFQNISDFFDPTHTFTLSMNF